MENSVESQTTPPAQTSDVDKPLALRKTQRLSAGNRLHFKSRGVPKSPQTQLAAKTEGTSNECTSQLQFDVPVTLPRVMDSPFKGGSIRGKRKLPANQSTSPLILKKKITSKEDGGDHKDNFCWSCHKEGTLVCCEVCPRSFHPRCASLDKDPEGEWVCPECDLILKAENVDTRSTAMQNLNIDQLCNLLKFAVSRMRIKCPEEFIKPVPLDQFPNYSNYVIHPMDLETLDKNIKKKMYGCTESFLADTKWILHNCIVYNGLNHRLTNIAKTLVKICKHEMNEIEVCSDCYHNAYTKRDNWFQEPCCPPHLLIWAKLKGFPFWPAKAMRIASGNVDVRFFGQHDRAWIPLSQCYALSKDIPSVSKLKKKALFEQSMEELAKHIKKLRERFQAFEYAANRSAIHAEDMNVHLQNMLPKVVVKDLRKSNYGKIPPTVRSPTIARPGQSLSCSPSQGVSILRIKQEKLSPEVQESPKEFCFPGAKDKGGEKEVPIIPLVRPRPALKLGRPRTDTSKKLETAIAKIRKDLEVNRVTLPNMESTNESGNSVGSVADAEKPPDGKDSTSSVEPNNDACEVSSTTMVAPEDGHTSENAPGSKPANDEEKTKDAGSKSDDRVSAAAAAASDRAEANINEKKDAESPTKPSDSVTPKNDNATDSGGKKNSDGSSTSNNSTKSVNKNQSAQDSKEQTKTTPSAEGQITEKQTKDSKEATVENSGKSGNSTQNMENRPRSPKMPIICTVYSRGSVVADKSVNASDAAKIICTMSESSRATMSEEQEAAAGPQRDMQSDCEDTAGDSELVIDLDADKDPDFLPNRGKKRHSSPFGGIKLKERKRAKPDRKTVALKSTSKAPPVEQTSNNGQAEITNTTSLPTLAPMGLRSSRSATRQQQSRVMPALQPRPAISASTSTAATATTEVTTPSSPVPPDDSLCKYSKKMVDFVRGTLEEMFRDLAKSGNPEATIKTLQLEMEKMQWRHQQELIELKHNTDLILMEMRNSMESEKQSAIADVKRQCELDKKKAVDQTKKNQWCAYCGKEGVFYCCWNTSYCDYPCQQAHWPQHVASCTQDQTGDESLANSPQAEEEIRDTRTQPRNKNARNFRKSTEIPVMIGHPSTPGSRQGVQAVTGQVAYALQNNSIQMFSPQNSIRGGTSLQVQYIGGQSQTSIIPTITMHPTSISNQYVTAASPTAYTVSQGTSQGQVIQQRSIQGSNLMFPIMSSQPQRPAMPTGPLSNAQILVPHNIRSQSLSSSTPSVSLIRGSPLPSSPNRARTPFLL